MPERGHYSRIRIIGLILGTFILAYLPVTSGWLAIKNDLFTGYFPSRYFLSASLAQGEFPIWNPFLNYGFPIYGDMSISYWSPITWIFAVIGYSPYSITLEECLYILTGGFGMYVLSGKWIQQPPLRIATALYYICSGYFTGHLQHINFIAGAGLLPWCILTFDEWLMLGDRRNFAKSLLVISLFTEASYPGSIIGLIFFLLVWAMMHIIRSDISKRNIIRRVLILGISILVLHAGMMYAWFTVLSETNRIVPLPISAMAEGSTNPTSWISFLFPLVPVAKGISLNDDLSLRNCYIGLLPLIGIFLYGRNLSNQKIKYLLFLGLLFLIISTSYSIPIIRQIPLLNYVRLNGMLRIFAQFSLLLAGMVCIDRWSGKSSSHRTSHIFRSLILVYALALLVALAGLSDKQTNILSQQFIAANWKSSFKWIIDHLEWQDALLLQSLVNLPLLFLLYQAVKKMRMDRLIWIIALECVLMTLLQLPFTGVGRMELAEIKHYVEKMPKGWVKHDTSPEKDLVAGYPKTEPFLGGWGHYSKSIALPQQNYHPYHLSKSVAYFDSGLHQRWKDHAYLFFQRAGKINEPVTRTFRSFVLEANVKEADTLVIKQIHFPGWTAKVNGKHTLPVSVSSLVVGIPVPAGKSFVEIQFQKPWVKWALWGQWAILLVLIIYLVLPYRMRYILPYPPVK